MDFQYALTALKEGKRVFRSGWSGKDMYVFYVGKNEKIFDGERLLQHLPYLCMKTADNKAVPWLASQTDILADDWGYIV